MGPAMKSVDVFRLRSQARLIMQAASKPPQGKETPEHVAKRERARKQYHRVDAKYTELRNKEMGGDFTDAEVMELEDA